MALAMLELVHLTAVIGPEVDLAADVRVGPFTILEGPMRVGPGCVIEAHACLSGPLVIGRDNFVGHGAVLGKAPQHKGYKGQTTLLRIGDRNTFREFVTVHRGTVEGGGETRIGDDNLLMVGEHLGHDVRMGNGCTLVNGALVAGHVTLDDGCILSGHSAVQQRVRIGRLAMLGGLGSTSKDVPPFVLQQGYNCVTGLNVVGLRKAGIASGSIAALRECFRILYKEGRSLSMALDRIEAEVVEVAEVAELVGFLRTTTLGINPARGASRVRGTY